MSIDVSELQVSSRDYVSIYNDLINTIPNVSQVWNSTDESDPGIVLVKLMAMYGDMLSYNHDRAVLEVYPGSVTQRKNAAQIFRLIGYKMRWYRSATCTAYLTNTSEYRATLPEYTKFSTKDGNLYYTYVSSDATKNPTIVSNMSSSGANLEVTLIQGFPRTPELLGTDIIPSGSGTWDSVYDFNVSKNDIQLNSRIYVSDKEIEETSITLIDDTGDTWTQVDNIDSLTESGKFYELKIDEYDKPYIDLVPYWENLNASKFKLFYIVSSGEDGQIVDNVIYKADSKIIAITGTSTVKTQTNISQYITISNEASSYGYNPETPSEARAESAKYVNTYDTLVTLSDFEKATKRIDGVANCVATDKTNDPNHVIEYVCSKDEMINNQISKTMSRNDISVHNGSNQDLYFKVKIVTATSLGLLFKDFCYASDTSGNLTTSEAGNKFSSGTITKLPSGDYQLSITTTQQLSGTEYLIAYYYTEMTNQDVRLYVTRTSEYEMSIDDETFKSSIISRLKENKLMLLNLTVDLKNVVYYNWSVSGTIYLKEKVSLDKAQDILVKINTALKYQYSSSRIGYNTIIGYLELIETIKSADSLINNIDIDPISYVKNTYNDSGNLIFYENATKEEITGKYKVTDRYSYNDTTKTFTVTFSHTPVKKGSVSIRIMDGRCVISDDKNGGLTSSSSIFNSGTIDYQAGTAEITLTDIDESYIETGSYISATSYYTKNSINMIVFNGINTNDLIISDDCIKDAYY